MVDQKENSFSLIKEFEKKGQYNLNDFTKSVKWATILSYIIMGGITMAAITDVIRYFCLNNAEITNYISSNNLISVDSLPSRSLPTSSFSFLSSKVSLVFIAVADLISSFLLSIGWFGIIFYFTFGPLLRKACFGAK